MALCILIVEDDAIIAMLLGDLLMDLGHHVCGIAGTEAEAIAAAVAHRPGLMIVDVNLGTESGVAAADVICSQSPVPCIFVSGDDAVLATLAGRGEVMAKPYRLAHIETAIARTFGTACPADAARTTSGIG